MLKHGDYIVHKIASDIVAEAKKELGLVNIIEPEALNETEKRIIRLIESDLLVPDRLNKHHRDVFRNMLTMGIIYLDHWDNKYKVS